MRADMSVTRYRSEDTLSSTLVDNTVFALAPHVTRSSFAELLIIALASVTDMCAKLYLRSTTSIVGK